MLSRSGEYQGCIHHMFTHMPHTHTHAHRHSVHAHYAVRSRARNIKGAVSKTGYEESVCKNGNTRAEIRHTPLAHTHSLYRCIKAVYRRARQCALSPLYSSPVSISLTHPQTHTCARADTLLAMQSNKTVVLHLSMLFMRKWRSGPWVMSSPTEMAPAKTSRKTAQPICEKDG